MWLLHIIYYRIIQQRPSEIGYQYVYAIYLDWLFILFWLIQSHPKIRSASAHSLDKYAHILSGILV